MHLCAQPQQLVCGIVVWWQPLLERNPPIPVTMQSARSIA
jgi:hypothetical protein